MAKHHNHNTTFAVVCIAELSDDGTKKIYCTDEQQIDNARLKSIELMHTEEAHRMATSEGHGKAVQGRFGSMGYSQDRRRRM